MSFAQLFSHSCFLRLNSTGSIQQCERGETHFMKLHFWIWLNSPPKALHSCSSHSKASTSHRCIHQRLQNENSQGISEAIQSDRSRKNYYLSNTGLNEAVQTGTGQLNVRRRAGKQHLLAKKNTKRKLRLSKMHPVSRSDYDNVIGALPHLKVNRKAT